MTKEITKSIILQEIQNKFRLRDFDPSKFLFDETVVPVYNVEHHLGTWFQNFKAESVTGTGGIDFFTVPQDEKWTIGRYDVVFFSGVYTVAGVYYTRTEKVVGSYLYLDLSAAQSVSYHRELPFPLVLQPGDVLSANVDGYTSTGILRLYLDYLKEKIR